MDSLFDLEPDVPLTQPPADLPIRDDQVVQIRTAFDGAGVKGQGERKLLIESVVFRDVKALRDLTAVEARRVIERLKSRTSAPASTRTGSSWDTRDEDTWIDKL